MFNNLNDKRFLAKLSSSIRHIQILASIPSEYFSDEGFNSYVNSGSTASPGSTINNKNNYLSFWVKDVYTFETFRVSEYEILMETSSLSEDEIEQNMIEYSEKLIDEELRKKYGELGFDKHYYKCKDIGMTNEESLKSVIDLIKEKIKKHNGK